MAAITMKLRMNGGTNLKKILSGVSFAFCSVLSSSVVSVDFLRKKILLMSTSSKTIGPSIATLSILKIRATFPTSSEIA